MLSIIHIYYYSSSTFRRVLRSTLGFQILKLLNSIIYFPMKLIPFF